MSGEGIGDRRDVLQKDDAVFLVDPADVAHGKRVLRVFGAGVLVRRSGVGEGHLTARRWL